MADSKITALTALTAADPTVDMFPVVDVSDTTMAASGTTKRISINNILACSPSATLASATITGALGAAGLNVTGSTIPANGVYLGSANNLSFSAASTLGMTLNATGLGVGVVGANGIKLSSFVTTDGAPATSGTTQTSGSLRIGAVSTTGAMDMGTAGSYSWIQVLDRGNLTINYDLVLQKNGGNVGIGVTPSAWGNAYKVVQTGQALGVYGRSNLGYYGTKFNLYNDNTNDVAITTNYVGEYRFELLNGSHVWLNKSSAGTAGVNQTLTQAMTLDASGNLILLSSNTPATLTTNGQLTVNATSNTNLRFSYRGSDGVTRVANITLA